ncbi:MFS transporter [Pseudomonas chlororaphis]|uniref:MFS transporter n=1 Tax=Pseudomonas chlororaphis TaxID=587753 RepID=UPI000F578800|nr:MFS transporter [Pseudomonas chlororaphis]AZD80276.1 putative MFS-type transporter [Pseudomonas chlororaphis subsp. aurantiaca]
MPTGNFATTASTALKGERPATLSGALVALLAFCCGAVVANLYYAQPIVELIAPQIGLSNAHASLIVSLTQLGYAAGLLLLVPLADLMENRRLVVGFTLAVSLCLIAAGFTESPSLFLALSLLIGLTSVAVQILVPLAAHMAPEESRGRVVGNIMSGLLLGILLSRPLSSLLAQAFGWRGVFFSAAGLMAVIACVMAVALPRRMPTHQSSYGELIGSVFSLARRHAGLRERSLYQGLLFASFSLFWTIVPIELIRQHGFSQAQVAVFALVGAVGAIAAPIAGRLADAGHGQRGTLVALLLAPLSLLIGALPGSGYLWLVVCAVLLDFAVQLNMVLGQREVYAIDPHSRARLNAVYMTSIFVGGALGSLVASPLYEQVGWSLSATSIAAVPGLALLLFLLRHYRQG